MSPLSTPPAAGTFTVSATYSGDGNYLTSTGACEPFTVGKAPSQTTTTVQSGGQTVTAVPLGTTVTDQATVTGTGAGTPTGTVSFAIDGNSFGSANLINLSATIAGLVQAAQPFADGSLPLAESAGQQGPGVRVGLRELACE